MFIKYMKYKVNYYNKLINNLQNDIFCRIKPSKLSGVGVFAIKDIPINTNPFKTTQKCFNNEVIDISEADLKNLNKEVLKMLNDFYHKIDGKYTLPKNGLNSNDISYYMNSSKNPNISLKNNGCNMISFYSNRNIKKGEELLIDYDKF